VDALDWSLFVVAPLDVLLVLTALLARGLRDPRWFLEALCQGLGVGAGGTFVVAVVSGLALSSGVLPAFLLLLLGPLAFGLCFALGASGVHLVRFLRQARGWRAPAEDHPSLPRAPAPVSRAHTSSASGSPPGGSPAPRPALPVGASLHPRYAQVRSRGGPPVGPTSGC